jgi:hypothetical protein
VTRAIYEAVNELLRQEPDWKVILTACLQLAEESPDFTLWGSTALNRSQQWDHSLVPLRTLGILETVEKGTRNHHTARYRTIDCPAVRQALIDFGIEVDARLPGDFFDQHSKKRRAKSPVQATGS